jgi:hypothetical protein
LLTVIRSDGPAGAKAGVIEMLLSGSGPATFLDAGPEAVTDVSVLDGVSVAIAAGWPECRPEPCGVEARSDVDLVSPFDVLFRKSEHAFADGNPEVLVSHGTSDDAMWGSLQVRDDTMRVTVATMTGEVLTSIDRLWLQTMALCDAVWKSRSPSGRARVEITLHYTTARLTAAQLAEALRVAQEWESNRDTA